MTETEYYNTIIANQELFLNENSKYKNKIIKILSEIQYEQAKQSQDIVKLQKYSHKQRPYFLIVISLIIVYFLSFVILLFVISSVKPEPTIRADKSEVNFNSNNK